MLQGRQGNGATVRRRLAAGLQVADRTRYAGRVRGISFIATRTSGHPLCPQKVRPQTFAWGHSGSLLRFRVAQHDAERLAVRATNHSPLDRNSHPVDDLLGIAVGHDSYPLGDPNIQLDIDSVPG